MIAFPTGVTAEGIPGPDSDQTSTQTAETEESFWHKLKMLANMEKGRISLSLLTVPISQIVKYMTDGFVLKECLARHSNRVARFVLFIHVTKHGDQNTPRIPMKHTVRSTTRCHLLHKRGVAGLPNRLSIQKKRLLKLAPIHRRDAHVIIGVVVFATNVTRHFHPLIVRIRLTKRYQIRLLQVFCFALDTNTINN